MKTASAGVAATATWPAFKVGLGESNLSAYLADLDTLLQDPNTGVFVDASVLIDSLKLGPRAVQELIEFLQTTLAGRIHVPLWAAHEFQQHLVKGTALSQLTATLKGMQQLGERVYSEIAPALSEAEDLPKWTAEQHRIHVRGALQDLAHSANLLKKWAQEVHPGVQAKLAEFVTAHCLRSKGIFSYFEGIGGLYENRAESRIPPGFKDRGKLARAAGPEATEGANASGDLLFWKEILDYLRTGNRWFRKRYEHIVILTNDAKNDWQIGRGTTSNPTDATFGNVDTVWGPVPKPHPMLEFEAGSVGGVKRIALCNGHLLAALLKTRQAAPTFVLSRLQIGIAQRASAPKAAPSPTQQPASPGRAAKAPARNTQRSLDAQQLLQILTTTHENVRAAALAHVQILMEIAAGTSEGNLATTLSEPTEVPGVTPAEIAALVGCELMRLADNSRAAAGDTVQQLLKELETLGSEVGSTLYAGVIFGKYIEAGSLKLRPKPILLEQIVEAETSPLAVAGLTLLHDLAAQQAARPLYLPNTASKPLVVQLTADRLSKGTPRVKSMQFGGCEVLTDIASTESEIWRLQGLAQAQDVTIPQEDLVSLAARYYGIPLTRLKAATANETYRVAADTAFVPIEEVNPGELS